VENNNYFDKINGVYDKYYSPAEHLVGAVGAVGVRNREEGVSTTDHSIGKTNPFHQPTDPT
jgi:hypothetical protein